MSKSSKKIFYATVSFLVLMGAYTNCSPSFEALAPGSSLNGGNGDLGNGDIGSTPAPAPEEPFVPEEPVGPITSPGMPEPEVIEEDNDSLAKLFTNYACQSKDPSLQFKEIFQSNVGRLTKEHYENSISLIFGIKVATDFTDSYSVSSYNSSLGSIISNRVELDTFFSSAQKVLAAILANNTVKQKVFSCKQESCVQEFINKWGYLLFRRPLATAETQSIFNKAKVSADKNAQSLQEFSLYYMLVSPQFIYRSFGESLPFKATRQSLSEFDLASRLSFFVWGSSPDSVLLTLASKNELRANLPAQLKRLLDDPRSMYLSRQLAYNWFSLGNFRHNNDKGYGIDGITLNQSNWTLAEQVTQFMNYLISENRPVHEIFNSDVMFFNKNASKLYGTNYSTNTNNFTKTKVSEPYLGAGVLSHMGLWANTAATTDFHVFRRGMWMIEKALCDRPPPFPENVSLAIESDDEGEKTLKETIVEHASSPACNFCHTKMDPYGIALERFNTLGQYRENYLTGEKINFDNKLIDGTPISGVKELGNYFASKERQQVNYCAMKNIVAVATGAEMFRGLGGDIENSAASCFSLSNYNAIVTKEDITFKELITNIVLNQSGIFTGVYKVSE